MHLKETIAATLKKKLLGTWRLTEWKKNPVDSDDESDVFGSNPTGYISYTPDGHVIVLVLRGDRVTPSKTPPTDKEKVQLFDSMFAYAGTYSIEKDRVVHKLSASWNDLWTDTVQVRFISFEKNKLIYTTPITIDPMDGKSCTYKVTLVRG